MESSTLMPSIKSDVISIIPAIINRHAGDAAFYWQQHAQAEYSPLIGFNHLQEFDRLLDAHLDGLRLANNKGLEALQVELDRWGSPNEIFVATVLGLESTENTSIFSHVLKLVERYPDRLTHGLVAGMTWISWDDVENWCMKWTRPGESNPLAIAAWHTISIFSQRTAENISLTELKSSLIKALADKNPEIRAAACRAATNIDASFLLRMIHDQSFNVRAEAVIAILQKNEMFYANMKNSDVLGVLHQCCNSLSNEISRSSGLHSNNLTRKLSHWLHQLAINLPIGDPSALQLIKSLPKRLGLWFALSHGDLKYLPWVIECMDDPAVSRLAGWTWGSLVGIPINSQGLSLPPRESELAIRPTDIYDSGLPEPNSSIIREFELKTSQDAPFLNGNPIHEENLKDLLWHAPQAIRKIASRRLAKFNYPLIDVRDHAQNQISQMEKLFNT